MRLGESFLAASPGRTGFLSGLGQFFLLSAVFGLLGAGLQAMALYFGFKRHFLGMEMFFAFVLLALGWRWLAGLVFSIAIGLELTLGMASVFRLFDLAQIGTMVGFAGEANALYLLMALGGAAVLLLFWYVLTRCLRLVPLWRVTAIGGALVIGQMALSFSDGNLTRPTMADRHHLLFGSTGHFLYEVLALNRQVFHLTSHEDTDYVDIAHPSAVQTSLGAPLPPKLLLIVAESWGMPRDPAVLAQQLQPLRRAPMPNDLGEGVIQAGGTTAFGEFRELCGKVPTKLNLRKISEASVGQCLPARLRQAGYRTVALHGAVSTMYDRHIWYPVVGFSELLLLDTLPVAKELPRCHSFPGLCDRDLFDVVANVLGQDKPSFLYWLTLNTHVPYDERDVASMDRALCTAVFAPGHAEQLCRYQNLQVEFFEGLSKLLSRPDMRGVEVIVVGDHAPIFNDQASRDVFDPMRVPMVHFTVK